MRKIALGGWVLAAAACSLTGIQYAFPSRQDGTETKHKSTEPTAQPEPDLTGIRARLSALEASQFQRPQPPAEVHSGTDPVQINVPEYVPVVPDPEVEAELNTRHRAQLDDVLELEGRDAAWAVPLEGMVSETLDTAEFDGTKLVDVDCAATLCRVEVEHDDQRLQHRFHEQIAATDVGRQGEGAWCLQLEVDGRPHSLYYIARVGYPELLSPAFPSDMERDSPNPIQ